MTTFIQLFPSGLSLQTSRVLLRPLAAEDIPAFRNIAGSPILWEYFAKELNDDRQLEEWVNDAVTERAAGKRVPFTIVDHLTGNVCGSTSFGNVSIHDQ